jgi:hypothetical protein
VTGASALCPALPGSGQNSRSPERSPAELSWKGFLNIGFTLAAPLLTRGIAIIQRLSLTSPVKKGRPDLLVLSQVFGFG